MMSEQKEKIQSDKERLSILQSELAFYKKLTKRQEKLIKKLLNAISGSKEQLHQIAGDTSYLRERFSPFDRKVYLEKVKRITEDHQE